FRRHCGGHGGNHYGRCALSPLSAAYFLLGFFYCVSDIIHKVFCPKTTIPRTTASCRVMMPGNPYPTLVGAPPEKVAAAPVSLTASPPNVSIISMT
ncbi:hypothetical protein HN873_008762, partial [Arachis hypogaea]